MTGYYNDNVRVDTVEGPVLVRIPVPRADQMDFRVWDESDVLHCISANVDNVPRLLHSSPDPPFQIHEFVEGQQLNDLAPRGSRVPPEVIPSVLTLLDQLGTVQSQELPLLPGGWPDDGDCAGFAQLLSGVTERVLTEHQPAFGALFRALGIPEDALSPLVSRWSTLTSRPFRAVHADVHRQNMVMSPQGVVFLDWELALWGDPVYDLAVHVHKMTYFDDELETLLRGWGAIMDSAASRSWQSDLTTYLRHERVKSAIVDTIRYTKEIIGEATPAHRRELLIAKLAGKLNAAGAVWEWGGGVTAEGVGRAIAQWSPVQR